MPPEKARFGNRGKGGGKGSRAIATAAMEVAVAAGATITATRTHGCTGEITTTTTANGEIEVAHTDPHGIGEDETRGAIAPLHRTHVTAIGL